MEYNNETFDLVLDKFLALKWMKGFPVEERSIEDRVRRIVRIVRNKPIQQCILEACVEKKNKDAADHFRWDHEWDGERHKFTGHHTNTFGSADKNDLEWLIDTIGEQYNELPTQRGIRELYGRSLLPADGKRVQDMDGD